MFQDRLQAQLVPALQAAFKDLFGHDLDTTAIGFQPTRPEFEGDVTINVFPFLKVSGKGPEPTATAIGEFLQREVPIVERFNVVKGFLNIVISDSYWLGFLREAGSADILQFPSTGRQVMVEYSSPNTNKPLHLGHLRNNFLGHSVSRILHAAGNEVVRVQIINDRGIHICKSMVAWRKFGKGETPESNGLKGDKLVGKYYVEFDKELKRQVGELVNRVLLNDTEWLPEPTRNEVLPLLSELRELQNRLKKEEELLSSEIQLLFELHDSASWKDRIKAFDAATSSDEDWRRVRGLAEFESKLDELKESIKELIQGQAPILLEAQAMLLAWEANDPEVRALWSTMNGWVYAGFNATYTRMGVEFDKLYYESQTYVLGKEDVKKGLEKGVFFTKPDGSVWVDNSAEGLDEKVLQRGDGTSLYMTQDIGTAVKRFEEFPGLKQLIYVVGNEQDYHFKVLFIILKKLGFTWAEGLHHLSYGMVDLPSGKMKSREGTVVDADDLMQEVVDEARKAGEELSKLDGFSEEEKSALYEMIGLAALKYYLLKVDPKKRMLFDPAASIDLQGHTGPFIQYTYARIASLRTKILLGMALVPANWGGAKSIADLEDMDIPDPETLEPVERSLLKILHNAPSTLNEAALKLDPSHLANYAYELTKTFNSFYQTVPVAKETDPSKALFRYRLCLRTQEVTKKAMWCLGIGVPERM